MAEYCSEQASDDDDASESSESEDSDDETGMDVDLPAMDPAERQSAMDKLVPGIEPSEDGKMPPSFYSNSQRVSRTTMETDVRENAPAASSSPGAGGSSRSIRPPILPRDKFDGVDSDDESDEEGDGDEEEHERG